MATQTEVLHQILQTQQQIAQQMNRGPPDPHGANHEVETHKVARAPLVVLWSFGDRVEVLAVSVSLSPSFESHPTLARYKECGSDEWIPSHFYQHVW
jgi:hypothetical protein